MWPKDTFTIVFIECLAHHALKCSLGVKDPDLVIDACIYIHENVSMNDH